MVHTPITPVTFDVAEDLADPFFIGKVRATDDDDDDTVTYSVDNASFTIDATGRLYSREALDHEDRGRGSHSVTATASDGSLAPPHSPSPSPSWT